MKTKFSVFDCLEALSKCASTVRELTSKMEADGMDTQVSILKETDTAIVEAYGSLSRYMNSFLSK